MLGALAGVELHSVEIPGCDRGESVIGPGRESDILGDAQAGVKEGGNAAEGEKVIGEEDDLAVGPGLLGEPLADGVKGGSLHGLKPFGGLLEADDFAAGFDSGALKGGYGVHITLAVEADLNDLLPSGFLAAADEVLDGRGTVEADESRGCRGAWAGVGDENVRDLAAGKELLDEGIAIQDDCQIDGLCKRGLENRGVPTAFPALEDVGSCFIVS